MYLYYILNSMPVTHSFFFLSFFNCAIHHWNWLLACDTLFTLFMEIDPINISLHSTRSHFHVRRTSILTIFIFFLITVILQRWMRIFDGKLPELRIVWTWRKSHNNSVGHHFKPWNFYFIIRVRTGCKEQFVMNSTLSIWWK